MARLAAAEKAEFYPTPAEVIEAIGRRLVPAAKGLIRLFDPCVGDGRFALLGSFLLQAGAERVETWGVELNPVRAEIAARKVDLVINAPFETVDWKPSGCCSLLWLNPPYDYSSDAGFARMEHSFLAKATSALAEGGLLVYIIPVSAVDRHWHLSNLLRENYEDIRVYRFPDDLFEFKQIVILGRRSQKNRRRVDHPILSDLARGDYLHRLVMELPSILEIDTPLPIPPSREKARLFRSRWSPEEMERLVEGQGGLSEEDILGPETGITEIEAVLPPKKGHIAQILASGLLNTIVLDGEIVKGRVLKSQEVVEESVEISDSGEIEKVVQRDVYTTHIVRVSRNGLEHLSSPDEVRRFLEENAPRLAAELASRIKPIARDPSPEEEAILNRLGISRALPGQKPGLLPDQKRSAVALACALKRHRTAFLVAEMGYGKTTVALATIELLRKYPALVLCPPHLVEKWEREAREVIPGVTVKVVESIGDLLRAKQSYRGGRLVVILAHSKAKLGPGWQPATAWIRTFAHPEQRKRFREAMAEYQRLRKQFLAASPLEREELRQQLNEARERALSQASRIPVCPECGQRVDDVERKPSKCPNAIPGETGESKPCKAPLYNLVGLRRWPIASFIKQKMPTFFKILIADEVHQFKGKDSDQGWAFQILSQLSPTLALTGTLFGGVSTSIFWLLHRTNPAVRKEFGYHQEEVWVDRFGVMERTIKRKTGEISWSRGRARPIVTARERPGISPEIVRFVLPSTVFRSIADLGISLPPFSDEVVRLEMTEEQWMDYARLYSITWEWLRKFWPRYTAGWLQWTLSRPNSCFRMEIARSPEGQEVVFPAAIPEGALLPKESWLVATVKAELTRGRRCLVYVRQSNSRDIRPRIIEVLDREVGRGYAKMLDASIAPRDREAWIRKNLPWILVTNPALVETGLDLIEYPTVIFFEPSYSLYTLWQSCRRVWRLGQEKPVKAYYLVYASSAHLPVTEDLALQLVGRKMRAAQMLYGDDVSGALVDSDEGDLVMQLVRALSDGSWQSWQATPRLFAGGSDSPSEFPARPSLPLSPTIEEWLAKRGMSLEDVRRQTRRRSRPSPVPTGQLALF